MVAPVPRQPEPPPPPDAGGDPPSDGWIELVKWLLCEHRRCVWVLTYVLVVLAALVGLTAVLAPHLTAIAALSGVCAGAGAGGTTLLKLARRQRRPQTDGSNEG